MPEHILFLQDDRQDQVAGQCDPERRHSHSNPKANPEPIGQIGEGHGQVKEGEGVQLVQAKLRRVQRGRRREGQDPGGADRELERSPSYGCEAMRNTNKLTD